jgi:hypothetical protein
MLKSPGFFTATLHKLQCARLVNDVWLAKLLHNAKQIMSSIASVPL